MDKLFFWVNLEDAYGFHNQFFVEENAFLTGLIVSLVIGVVVSAAYYFGCCNSKTSLSTANIPSWVIALCLAGGLSYLVADFAIIGKANTVDEDSMFRRNSFYVSMQKHYENAYASEIDDEQQLQPVMDEMTEISNNLDAGKDVRLPFDLGCVIYAILFFYITSICVKGMTSNGAAIPHKWPN